MTQVLTVCAGVQLQMCILCVLCVSHGWWWWYDVKYESHAVKYYISNTENRVAIFFPLLLLVSMKLRIKDHTHTHTILIYHVYCWIKTKSQWKCAIRIWYKERSYNIWHPASKHKLLMLLFWWMKWNSKQQMKQFDLSGKYCLHLSARSISIVSASVFLFLLKIKCFVYQ